MSERSIWVRKALVPPTSAPVDYDGTYSSAPLQIASKVNHPFFDAEAQNKIDDLSGSSLSSGNHLELLPNWRSMAKKSELADLAKESILIISLQIVCDEGGQELVDHLVKAAQRGVVVRMVLDGGFWGSMGSGTCFKQLKRAGIIVRRSPYRLLPGAKNFQLHDKLFIVDATTGITGGQNMGSWWSKSTGINEFFRDTDILAEGPVVLDMAKRALDIWLQATEADAFTDAYARILTTKRREFRKRSLLGKQHYKTWLSEAKPGGICRFVGHDPHLGTFHIFDTYAEIARLSQKQIVFQVPSLNAIGTDNQKRLLDALKTASAKPGVHVDLITNGPGFLKAAMTPSTFGRIYALSTLPWVYDSVVNSDIHVYIYRAWLHSKLVTFDGLIASVGSFNFDQSGLEWSESTLICIDPKLLDETKRLLAFDFANSTPIGTPWVPTVHTEICVDN